MNMPTLEHAGLDATQVRAGFVPPGFKGLVDSHLLELGAINIEVPAPTPEQLVALAQHVRAHQTIKQWPVHALMQAIDRVVHRLLDAQNPQRQLLNRLLAQTTGLDEEMLRLGLTRYLQSFRTPQLQRFVVEDLGNPSLLDRFEPRAKGGLSMAVGPQVLMHVWAGNVPGLPLWSLVAGLLVKAGNVCKLPSAEPLVASLFAHLIAREAPELADGLAVVWWPGGDTARESAVFSQADALMAYGDNPTLTALRAQVPITTRFLPFGHKLSFGMVSAEGLDARRVHEVARLAALDVARFEQQGCYSPQVFYVARGGRSSPLDFAHHLQQQLRALSQQHPRRELSLSERQALANWRSAQETAAMAGQGVVMLGDASDPFGVAYSEALSFSPSALNRTVLVVAVDDLSQVPALIAPHRDLLQTVGLATAPQELMVLSKALALSGVTRICAIGSMTLPEAAWHHDGRFNLADLVQMVDIEHSAERAADDLAPYTD